VPAGRFGVRTSLQWSNSFSWTQDVAGETPEDRRFLLDGETAILDLTLRRGVSANLDLGLRLTALGRGGGTLDGFIDAWHRLTNVPDGKRPHFVRDAFRVEGLTTEGRPFSWNAYTGWGLGPLELDARWRVEVDDAMGARLVLDLELELGYVEHQLLAFGHELVERRVDRTNRDRRALHRSEDAVEVLFLHRQQQIELRAAVSLVVR